MKKSDFYYELPEELIAQKPIENREESRLLVLKKSNGNILHKNFKDITGFLNKGDCLVLNNTRVIPARLFGKKHETGSNIEFLLLNRINEKAWEVILKPGKKAKIGTKFVFGDGALFGTITNIIEDGKRIVQFEYNGVFEDILNELGIVPLPPYIKEKLSDKERYQTVYSKVNGSVAAPTAGLHFTENLLSQIKNMGICIAYVTLHVGLGTFRPVKSENIEEHIMHKEYFNIDKENADKINFAKKNGSKIIAVGTTVCRVLETVSNENGVLFTNSGFTDIFIKPGYKFKIIDRLITNFHLPESTLLMLVSAFSGYDNIFKAYKEAINEKYRFFSFGDAMYLE